MKTLILSILSIATVAAQSSVVPHWLETASEDAVMTEFFENLEVTRDYIVIEASEGDRLALWDNSGVILFDHTFRSDQTFQLSIAYYLSGTYHLGIKKSGMTGRFTSINLSGEEDLLSKLIKRY